VNVQRTLIIIAASLLVVACGGDDDVPSTSDPAATPGSKSLGGQGAAGTTVPSFTAPGTKLAFNENAIVPFASEDQAGALGVAVTRVDVGTAAELASFELGDKVAGMTPYYVHVQVTNETGANFAYTSLGLTNATLADGEYAQDVTMISDFAPCDNASAPKEFTTKGAVYETCIVGLAGAGTSVTGMAYTGGTYDKVPSAPNYSAANITWTQ